jgi:hypothetical protein
MKYVVTDLRQVDYEFECEALADFKYSIAPEGGSTNLQTEKEYVRDMEMGRPRTLNEHQALSFIQPKNFVKGRNW